MADYKFTKEQMSDLNSLLSVMSLIFLFFLFMASYVYRNVEMSQAKYQISQLKEKRMKLYLDVEELRLSVAQKSTVSRIDTLFRQRYGNISPSLGSNISSVELPQIQIKEVENQE